DGVVAVDRLADLQDFRIAQILHAAGVIDAQLVGDLHGRGAADTVNVGERDDHALVGGDVYPGNTSHLLLHAPQGPGRPVRKRTGGAPLSQRCRSSAWPEPEWQKVRMARYEGCRLPDLSAQLSRNAE